MLALATLGASAGAAVAAGDVLAAAPAGAAALRPVTTAQVADATGLPSPVVADLLATLAAQALLRPAPAGEPTLRKGSVGDRERLLDTGERLSDAGERLSGPDAGPDADAWLPAVGLAAARPRPAALALTAEAIDPGTTDATAVARLAADLPDPARRILDALTWGPPVGRFTAAPTTTSGAPAAPPAPTAQTTPTPTAPEDENLTLAVEHLLERHLVRRTPDGGVVLPAAVALALREGRTHRDLTPVPPTPPAPVVSPDVVAAESARAALELHRLLAALTDLWGDAPAGALRSGGVGVREIRRTTAALGATEQTTTLLVELAAAAGEIGQAHDDDGALWAPTDAHDGDAPTHRWARLVHVWLHSERAFALVGTRADDGALRSALEPGLERGWAARLRRRVLDALATWPTGSAPDADAVRGVLTWQSPISPPPDWAVTAVLAEADVLGVVAAGALSRSGAALTEGAEVTDLAASIEADLPPAVGEILLQADLTAVVPGRPSPEVAALLEATADVESRGSALTARFTPASLERAVAGGRDAAEILAALTELSRTPVPQALEYAVRDAERRTGGLRAGPAAAYLRGEDAAALAQLVAGAGAELGLRLIAPTVAVTSLPAGRLALALREAGRGVVLEGPTASSSIRATAIAPWPHRLAARAW
ncbi:helicase-associated domain-containing protein [Litorihabitans aurantiacus]|uniref:Helicase XPB/Ssl2 N-terminal domain-containing protein n=1 Tax=Litorihabitans aurantiacus TaxID=1930061 RepID=A0AA37UJL7_9MICO|nr:helicase-associated domain-containing protein [Litorihabitans aurantiacus]GMA30370.1 hypothetical protein GCM10025875_03620 [Litorihabitans aurantiacus]